MLTFVYTSSQSLINLGLPIVQNSSGLYGTRCPDNGHWPIRTAHRHPKMLPFLALRIFRRHITADRQTGVPPLTRLAYSHLYAADNERVQPRTVRQHHLIVFPVTCQPFDHFAIVAVVALIEEILHVR